MWKGVRASGMGYRDGFGHQEHREKSGKEPTQRLVSCRGLAGNAQVDFSVVSKEFQFSTGDGLIMTATARAKEWKVGNQAAAILQGSELLVLDSL